MYISIQHIHIHICTRNKLPTNIVLYRFNRRRLKSLNTYACIWSEKWVPVAIMTFSSVVSGPTKNIGVPAYLESDFRTS